MSLLCLCILNWLCRNRSLITHDCVQPHEYISEEHTRPSNALQDRSITYSRPPEEELPNNESGPTLFASSKLGAETKHLMNTNIVVDQERDQLNQTPIIDQELAGMADYQAKLITPCVGTRDGHPTSGPAHSIYTISTRISVMSGRFYGSNYTIVWLHDWICVRMHWSSGCGQHFWSAASDGYHWWLPFCNASTVLYITPYAH